MEAQAGEPRWPEGKQRWPREAEVEAGIRAARMPIGQVI